MSWPILQRLRPAIAALNGYSSAHMESPQVTENASPVRLNANELPQAPAQPCGLALNRYPHPQPPDLRQRLADLWGCAPENLLLTRGSDEAIDVLVRAFCEAGSDAVAITPPVFGMYEVAATIQGAQVVTFPLHESRDFQPDLAAMVEQLPQNTKLVFLCSPNNPTGSGIATTAIEDFCARLSERALVVVDEAYVEFSHRPSLVSKVEQYRNLAVLRTVSKAWGLAGARLGGLVVNARLLSVLAGVLPPYPVPEPVRHAVMRATEPAAIERASFLINAILAEKQRLQQALAAHPLVQRVFASETNFLLVRFHQAPRVLAACAEAGLLLRDQSGQPGLADCLRITVGQPDENRRLLQVLDDLQGFEAKTRPVVKEER